MIGFCIPHPILLSLVFLTFNFSLSYDSIPKTIGIAIPKKATFFITYIMVDGWAGIAGEILMLKPLIIFHLKNFFLVKTEKDRAEAMDPGSLGFNSGEPRIQFYFLLGLVYATVTPLLLPFIIVFFALAYVVFRHQVKSQFFDYTMFNLVDNLKCACRKGLANQISKTQYFRWFNLVDEGPKFQSLLQILLSVETCQCHDFRIFLQAVKHYF